VQSIPRLLAAASLAAGVILPVGGAAVQAVATWRDAPDYASLLVPANQRSRYAIAVTPASLDDVAAEAAADPTAVATPGAWQPHGESPPDAFGTAGPYNRWLVARLYGSQQPRVARGARMDRGRVVEAWTLISPYPSADLRRLHPGTMRLILRVAP
jgi:hypothetical protein